MYSQHTYYSSSCKFLQHTFCVALLSNHYRDFCILINYYLPFIAVSFYNDTLWKSMNYSRRTFEMWHRWLMTSSVFMRTLSGIWSDPSLHLRSSFEGQRVGKRTSLFRAIHKGLTGNEEIRLCLEIGDYGLKGPLSTYVVVTGRLRETFCSSHANLTTDNSVWRK